MADRPHALRRWRRFAPVVVPVLFGTLLLALGHRTQGLVLLGLSALMAVLIALGVPVARYIERFAAAIAHGVSFVLTGVVGLLLVVVGGVLRVVGIAPLSPGRGGWVPATRSADADRLASATFGLERPGRTLAEPVRGPVAVLRRVTLAVGVVAVLVLADVSLGFAWERLSRSETPVGDVADAINLTGSRDTVADPRADTVAMSAYPWADAYFREVQLTPGTYWPFTEYRPQRFEGEFVTTEGWSRRSYQADGMSGEAPVVWMFGGSTTWGEGQRDEYTIASHLARIAEREGTPIVVRNFGQRGWTHFQEMVLFEQLLAEEPAPDVALFYDGANEINTQTLSAKGVPTHTLVDAYAQKISGGIADEFRAPPPPPPNAWATAWDAYVGQSALFKTARWLRDVVDPVAGAATGPPARQGADGGTTNYVKTEEDARRAVDVYERGRYLTMSLAERHDVTPLLLWQPQLKGEPEIWAAEHISEPTIDISDTLEEHVEVFIDGGHTNEEGARIVAERIWEELRPLVADAYS